MIILPLIRRRRHAKKPTALPRPPAALTLVAADYANYTLTLTFDRPIDISGLNGGAIAVLDPDAQQRFQPGGDAGLADPNTVALGMASAGDYFGGGLLLDAAGDSGIVAMDDGGAWAGVSGVGLPFP